jgi:hypothetical protein
MRLNNKITKFLRRKRNLCLALCIIPSLFIIYQIFIVITGILVIAKKSNDLPVSFIYINPYDSKYLPIFTDDNENDIYNYYRKLKHQYKTYVDIGGTNEKTYKEDKRRIKSINKSFYMILEYTKVFGREKYCNLKLNNETQSRFQDDDNFKRLFQPSSQSPYHHLDGCKFKNCFFSCNRNLIHEADAVLFHEADLYKDFSILPTALRRRTYDQIWTLFNDEANFIEEKYDDLKFNWTMSFHATSEVSYCAYGCYTKLKKKVDINVFLNKTLDEFKNRQDIVVWFNSNCQSTLRIQFAGELANYFPSMISGACSADIGQYIHAAAKDEILKDENYCKRFSECEKKIFETSKFYLAFESLNCSDYITEKFWRSLSYGLIPVVLQPPKRYYEHVAPYNSFIHVEDFDFDMKKLAVYLKRVVNDYNLYATYFKWKFNYKISFTEHDVESYRLCEFCARLNSETSSIHYKSISKWYNKKCFRKNAFESILN